MAKLHLPWAWTPDIGAINSIILVEGSTDIITMHFFHLCGSREKDVLKFRCPPPHGGPGSKIINFTI